MASTNLKDTGTQQLLLGLLLLSLSVSSVLGQLTTLSPPVSTNVPTATTVAVTLTTTTAPTAVSTTAQQSTSSGATTTAITTPQPTNQSTSTAGSTVATVSSYNTSMNSSMSNATMANTTVGMNGTTTWNNSSMGMLQISCHSFMCNYSDCYSMFTSQNTSMCPSGYNYCELIRQMGMCYTVSCSASCSSPCFNASQSNCSVNCCNSTGCLNDTFASMMNTPTTVMPTTTKATTSPATTKTTMAAPTTVAGNKCHTGTCNGTDCYKSFNIPQICTSSQPHCQLKKETVGSALQWTAGCTTNCSGQTTCKASTQPPCHLECCNATVSSCLWLNGTLNVPSFATRGPQLHSELVTSALLLFAITLML